MDAHNESRSSSRFKRDEGHPPHNDGADSLTIADGLGRRRDNFLLLRVIAAVMVIYGHALGISPMAGVRDLFAKWGEGTYSGEIAVDMFFALSGFMVTGSFIRRPDFIDFMSARLLRLVPALLLCVLITAFVIGPAFTTLSASEYFSSPLPLRYAKLFLLFSPQPLFNLPGVFTANPIGDTVNGSLWTLPSELRMYVLLAIAGTIGILRYRRATLVLVLGLFTVGFASPERLPLLYGGLQPAAYFGLGVLAYQLRERIPVRTDIMFAIGLLAYICRPTLSHPVILALALTYFCFWFAYVPQLPALDKWGDPSYGIYLWGWPISQMFAYFVGAGHPYLCTVTASVGAITAGYISWHAVERPAMDLKKHIKWPSRRPPAV